MKKVVVVVAFALAVVPAAIGGASTRVAGDLVAGCSKGLPDDFSVNPKAEPVRCDVGYPLPVPLKEKVTIQVAQPGLTENSAPLLMAIDKGEFAKENLDVQATQVATATAMQLLAQGKLDVFNSQDASFFNYLGAGFKLTNPVSGFYSSPDSKDGLWIRTDRGINGKTLKGIKGKSIGSIAGAGSPVFLGTYDLLRKQGLTLKDISFSPIAATDVGLALKNGAVDGAMVISPVWAAAGLDKDPTFKMVVGFFPQGEPASGLVFGTRLQTANMKLVREAIIRVYVRTLSTYFRGDYKKDPKVVADLSRILKQPEATVTAAPAFVWDYVGKDGTLSKIQKMFREAGVLNYPKNINEKVILARDDLRNALSKPATTTKK